MIYTNNNQVQALLSQFIDINLKRESDEVNNLYIFDSHLIPRTLGIKHHALPWEQLQKRTESWKEIHCHIDRILHDKTEVAFRVMVFNGHQWFLLQSVTGEENIIKCLPADYDLTSMRNGDMIYCDESLRFPQRKELTEMVTEARLANEVERVVRWRSGGKVKFDLNKPLHKGVLVDTLADLLLELDMRRRLTL